MITALVATVISLLFVGIGNLVVDPFASFRLFDSGSDPSGKPAIYNRVKLAKAYDLRRIRPEALVLGTSRSHIALRMTHPGWKAPAGRKYNGAFDGASTQEMFAFLQHAQTLHPLKQVVLGIDSWQLRQGDSSVSADFDPALLFQPGKTFHNAAVYFNDLSLMISLDTLKASFVQIRTPADEQISCLAPDGQRLGNVFFRKIEDDFSTSPGEYFRNVDRQELSYMAEDEAPKTEPTAEPLSALDYLEKIVAFCRKMDIDLRVYLTPQHAHQLEIMAETGGWETFEENKRKLVLLFDREAAAHPGSRPFPLYDFNSYSSVTTEAVPPAGVKTEMNYYWDSSHFKESVGDWILDRLFSVHEGTVPAPKDFGVPLTMSSVESVLTQTRKDREIYRSTHPADIAFIKDVVAAAKARNQLPGSSR